MLVEQTSPFFFVNVGAVVVHHAFYVKLCIAVLVATRATLGIAYGEAPAWSSVYFKVAT